MPGPRTRKPIDCTYKGASSGTGARRRASVDFKDDEKSIRELHDVLGSYKPGRHRIDIIVDGVVETRHPPYGLVGNEGQRIGFGAGGGAPAQIIVKRVVSLKVTPVKAIE